MSAPIKVSDSAALKVKSLIDEEKNPQLCLRVYVIGGGCSGFQYGFTFDETINSDDCVIEKHLTQNDPMDLDPPPMNDDPMDIDIPSVKFVVDPMSLQYLMGAEIDYKEDIKGAQFTIRNPNAKTTCGCGSSFDVAS